MSIFKYKVYFLFILVFLVSCKSENDEVTLNQWVKDERAFSRLLDSSINDCDSIKNTYAELKTQEFQSKLYGCLSECFIENPEKVKHFLRSNIRSGLHPDRIDSIKYSTVYGELKPELKKLQEEFWRGKDTTIFNEIEKRVKLDQDLSIKYRRTKDTVFKLKREEVFKENTKYLLAYCRENGYPYIPEMANFNYFRKNMSASVIAIHADYAPKIELFNHSIKAAKSGKISWFEPISICVTFHTNAMRHKSDRPIFFLDYQENNKLNIENSYLQLYSIQKHYSQDMNRKILLRPSKFNKNSNDLIKKQLGEIKDILVNEFYFPIDDIQISYELNENEIDYRFVKPYLYTISSFKK